MSIVMEPVRRRTSVVALSICLAATASAAAVGATAEGASAQQVAPKRLEARLTGSGDPDGSGEARFRLNKAQHTICATVEWHKIQKPNAAHIHRRSDGGVVVDLTGSVTGGPRCATKVSSNLIGKILAHPGRYYFNVHNKTYPSGAIQGTLHR